jgi:hemerythrin superfamily protein
VDSSVLHRVDDLLDNNKNEEKQLFEYLKYLYNESNNEYEKPELIRKLFYSTKKLKKLSSLFFSQKKSPNKFIKKITKNLDDKQ